MEDRQIELDFSIENECVLHDVSPLYFDTYESYQLFFNKCLALNRPAIIRNATKDWPCLFSLPKELSFIFPDALNNTVVSVAVCDVKAFNAQKTIDMTIFEYKEYWKTRCSDKPTKYLKDCHLNRYFPPNSVYYLPKFFASDWLGEFYDAHPELNDDYRFLYLGPKQSWTPLHRDVFSSFSWSANVVGRKRWLLVEPGYEKKFRDSLGNLPFEENLTVPSDVHHRTWLVEQEEGEAIFVPSGWYHQVWNLEDTLSINHNWVNGNNIGEMWFSMKENLEEVKKELNDLRDSHGWNDQCQMLLRAHCGFDYHDFFRFLRFIMEARINAIMNCRKYLCVFGNWYLGPEYCKFDLSCLLKVLTKFASDDDVVQLTFRSETPCDTRDYLLQILDNS